MGMDENNQKLSVYIDLQNVSHNSIPAIIEQLAGTWGTCTLRAYGSGLMHHRKLLRDNGIHPIETAPSKSGKNAADIALTADAVEELCRGQADAFAVISGDRDFTALASKIRQWGKPIWGFGPPNTPHGLRKACTIFFELQPVGGGKKKWRVGHGEARTEQFALCSCRLCRKLRHLVGEFIANAGRRTVDAFGEFVRYREPTFSPKQYGAGSISSLLRKLAVCELRPVRNKAGVINTYELILGDTQGTDSKESLSPIE
jgi:hypothetical protein